MSNELVPPSTEQERRLIPVSPDIGEEELKAWRTLIDGICEATVARVDQERHIVRWDGVEPQHVRRVAHLACDLIVGLRRLPDA